MATEDNAEANTKLQYELTRMHRQSDRRKAREDLQRKRNRDNADPDTIPSLEELAKMASMGFQTFRMSAKSRKTMAKHRANPLPCPVQIPEHDQSADSAMMRLPADLRNRIYEDALVYDGRTQPAMAPQLLLGCKQIRREAQGILNGNLDNIALIRLSSANSTLISHNLDSPTEVLAITSFDTALESWASIPGKKTRVLIDVHLVGDGKDTKKRPRATYPLVNQQLFLLTAALVGSQVQEFNFKLTVSNHWPTGIDYDKCFWPLTRVPRHIKFKVQGVPDLTQQYLITTPRHWPDYKTMAMSVWLEAFAETEALISKVERAGIKEGNVLNLLQSHRSRLFVLAERASNDDWTGAWIVEAVRQARDTLHEPMWMRVRDQAEQVLCEKARIA